MPVIPKKLFGDFEKILFDEVAIQNRIRALGEEVNKAYAGNELTVIAIANGALVFAADLIRKINLPVRFDSIHVNSYQNQIKPVSSPEIISNIRLDIRGSDVLLIDDILDTGNTLIEVSKKLQLMHPNSLKTCVLLDKKVPRRVEIKADFTGFEISDKFVAGYGLDFAGYYRQLPCIGVLKKELTLR